MNLTKNETAQDQEAMRFLLAAILALGVGLSYMWAIYTLTKYLIGKLESGEPS